MFDIKCNIEDYYIQALDHTKEISFIKWLLLFKTRPNGSTRSEDYSQMTTLFNPNEYNDFV